MLSAFGFAKFLLENTGEHKSTAEVSLYNAFRSLQAKETPLTRADLVRVYKRLMLFPHWRSKKSEIDQHIAKHFKNYMKQEGEESFSLPIFENLEIFKLKSEDNIKKFLTDYYSQLYPQAKVRCTKANGGSFLVIVLRETKEICLYHVNDEFVVLDGKTSPLMDSFVTHYNANLELDQTKAQNCIMKPFRMIRLEPKASQWTLFETQGYSLKNLMPKQLGKLDDLPEIFYHLKSLESKFIHKSSDPLYLSLTRELELCIENLAENTEQYKEKALETYQKARNIFENVFPDDRLLHLLLKELAISIASDRAKTWDEPDRESKEEWLKMKNESPLDSTNLLPIVE